MGMPEKPSAVKLIAGIIASSNMIFDKAEKFLAKAFGKVDYKSPCIDFDYTDYYSRDMGEGLSRVFLSFERLISPERLPVIKLFTNKIEARLAKGFKGELNRPANIDPGYITAAKLILASTKDYSHRVYLAKGIYAENTLYYRDKRFMPFDWTYPDYRTGEYRDVFAEIRKILMKQKEA